MISIPEYSASRFPDGPIPAPPHAREIDRLASLCGLHLDVVEPDPLFDEIARQAALRCGAPYATVTVVREHEQAFLGNLGMPGGGGDREEAICAHTILEREALVVEDLRKDRRFAGLGIVTGPPGVRFYAGVPMFDTEGLPLGSVCVLGTEPRPIDTKAILALGALATKAGVLLEARRVVAAILGPNPHPVALHRALTRMNDAMSPLFS